MPQIKKVSIRFVQTAEDDYRYTDDRSQIRTTVYVARVPFSLYNASNAVLTSIYEAGGGVVAKIGGQVINAAANNSQCGESSNIKPRKLQFVLNTGESLTVPVSKRENLVSAANDVITGIPDGTSVACIQLIGEKIGDLLAELGGNYTGVPVTEANNSKWYTGNAAYSTDLPNTVQLPFKIASPNGTAPPDILVPAWNGCVGALTSSRSCGGNASRYEKRKYIPNYIIGSNSGGDNTISGDASNEIPVVSETMTDIQACGEAIVTALGGALFCLPYQGHGDNLFHLNEGITLA